MSDEGSSASSSISDITWPSSIGLQQTNSSSPSTTYTLTEWMGFRECMDSLARMIDIENPMNGPMQPVFNRILINMTNELLADMLSVYSNLFKKIIVLIQFDNDMPTDDNSVSVFSNNIEYQETIILLYYQSQQLFSLLVSHENNVLKVYFDNNDTTNVRETIINWFNTWDFQNSISTNDTDNRSNANDVANSVAIEQLPDNANIYLPASKVLHIRLQRIHELILRTSGKLDQIKLKIEPTEALLNDFDRFNDSEKMNMIVNELVIVLENFRMAMPTNHEEQTETIPSMETDDERVFDDPTDTTINVNHSTVREQHDVPVQLNLPKTTNMTSNTYAAPQILEEPTEYQHVRMFSELASGICPLIQGGGKDAAQQTYVEIEVPPSDLTDLTDLYVRVTPVTVELSKHPYKAVVPENAKIDQSKIATHVERKRIKGDQDNYDQEEECSYLRITPEERTAGKKEIKAYLIRWPQLGGGLKENENKNLSLCKLEFCFCIPIGSRQYKRVSPKSYSSIIKEGDGPVTIGENPGQTRNICDQGGQIIEFSLSVKCLKRDFSIVYNKKSLSKQNFKIVGKQLLVTTPTKEENQQNLDLTILRDEYDDDSQANINRILFHGTFHYVSHDTLGLHNCIQKKLSSTNN